MEISVEYNTQEAYIDWAHNLHTMCNFWGRYVIREQLLDTDRYMKTMELYERFCGAALFHALLLCHGFWWVQNVVAKSTRITIYCCYKYLYVKGSFLTCGFQELNWTITNFTVVQGSFVRICISCDSYHWTNKDIGHNMHTKSYCELLHKMQKKLVN